MAAAADSKKPCTCQDAAKAADCPCKKKKKIIIGVAIVLGLGVLYWGYTKGWFSKLIGG